MSMTEIESKKYMLIEKECINRNCNRDCANCDIVQNVEDLNNAYDIAINALEKQIPKKPKKSQSKLRYLGTYMCPSCGGDFSGTGVASYCYHCGQRFKWNDAEDWSDGE